MGDELRDWLEELAGRIGIDALPAPGRAAMVVVCAAIGLVVLWRWLPAAPPAAEVAVESVPASASVGTSPSAPASITVHVVGAVRRPGVYVLASGSRACDAVDAAGGMLGSAEPGAVNLARVLDDGEQLVFPKKGEAAQAAGPAGTAGGSPAGVPAASARVDINRAGAEELDALPGIGPATAKKIVDDRAANGPFRAVEDLLRVPGIGPAKLDGMKDLVTVG